MDRRNGVRDTVAKQPELHSAMYSFYNEMIAIGGHPNPDAIDLMTILDFKEGEENGMVYLTQLACVNIPLNRRRAAALDHRTIDLVPVMQDPHIRHQTAQPAMGR